MRGTAVRVVADRDEKNVLGVCVTIGNIRRVGAVDEIAWAIVSPDMAREIASQLFSAADEVERRTESRG